MKDRHTILNEMVLNVADIMEAKAEYLELVAQQYEEDGNIERAEEWRKDLPKIQEAVALIRSKSGCWI